MSESQAKKLNHVIFRLSGNMENVLNNSLKIDLGSVITGVFMKLVEYYKINQRKYK